MYVGYMNVSMIYNLCKNAMFDEILNYFKNASWNYEACYETCREQFRFRYFLVWFGTMPTGYSSTYEIELIKTGIKFKDFFSIFLKVIWLLFLNHMDT